MALVGVGYLVGIGACLALLTGVVIAWGIAVPLLTVLGQGEGATASEMAESVWSGQVRLIGAGIIAVGGLWTVGSLARPIVTSIRAALASARASGSGMPGDDQPRAERDLPITWVLGAALVLAAPSLACSGCFPGAPNSAACTP
ncbi:OPT/YSL family transporter [Methylorubrum suomiense]